MLLDLNINMLLGGGIYDVSVFLFPSIILPGSMILERKAYIVFLFLAVFLFTCAAVGSYYIYKAPQKTQRNSKENRNLQYCKHGADMAKQKDFLLKI